MSTLVLFTIDSEFNALIRVEEEVISRKELSLISGSTCLLDLDAERFAIWKRLEKLIQVRDDAKLTENDKEVMVVDSWL